MGGCSSKNEEQPNPDRVDLTHFEVFAVIGKGGFGKVNVIQRKLRGKNNRNEDDYLVLKRMSKEVVMKSTASRAMVWNERNIMIKLDSPFLVGLVHAFQTPSELFLVMPYMKGGDLRFHMKPGVRMDETVVQFYAAQIMLGLEALHNLNIVYRDLKPDNALLDEDGHLRLSDFGISEQLEERRNWKTTGRAGTFGYQAPEVLTCKAYGAEADVWSFGVMIFEMCCGKLPWNECGPILSNGVTSELNHNIKVTDEDMKRVMSTIHISHSLSKPTRSLIKGLMALDRNKRLGCGERRWDEVKEHSFFHGLNWDKMARRRLEPFIKPNKESKNSYNTAAAIDMLIDHKPKPISEAANRLFADFDWNVDMKNFQPSSAAQSALARD